MDDDSEDTLGMRFWLGILGLTIVAVVSGALIMVMFGRLWYAWGFFGAFIVFSLVAIGFGWLYDRRERRHRDRLAGE
jgi:Na+/melibiose symporter-like transporter